MKHVLRFAAGAAVMTAVLIVGYLFGIRPTLAEVVLVAMACGSADAVREVFR